MPTLLLAEHDDASLNPVTARALTAAKALGAPVHVLVVGENARAAAEAAAKLDSVAEVLLADAPAYAHRLAEPVAALGVALAKEYGAVVAPSTAVWKSVMPRIAALLDVMQVSDVIAVVAPDTFDRPIYAGNAIQRVRAPDGKKVLTIRTASFAATGEATGASSAPIRAVEPAGTAAGNAARSSFVGEEIAASARPELTAARIIVSGGRAVGSAENFHAVIEPLADALGAAVGASRAAVDAGYAPNDWQVGQTGKVVAPDLYIALGISGAIQHLAGMKDSKVIVAVNKDEEAPIFQVADFGIVGDLFEVVPALKTEIAKAKA
ncbi:electron transfer flavoprotein subunit alpha/FixB family protein [Ancylobacter moscoviensis]